MAPGLWMGAMVTGSLGQRAEWGPGERFLPGQGLSATLRSDGPPNNLLRQPNTEGS